MNKVVVTGAAGFIGSKLVEALIAEGRSVEGVDNFATGRKDRLPSGVKLHKLDLVKASDNTLLEVLDGAKTLYHLAAIKKHNTANNPKLLVETNFVSAQNLFRLARISGIERIIYTSSLYAYGRMGGDKFAESMLPVAQSYYGTTKLCSEYSLALEAESGGFGHISARLFFTYGPKQYARGGYISMIENNITRGIRGENLKMVGSGSQVMDFTHVENMVSDLITLEKSEYSGTVNVGSGEGISVREVLEIIRDFFPTSKIEAHPSDWTEGSKRVADVSLLKSIIGPSARIPFRSGIERLVHTMSKEL